MKVFQIAFSFGDDLLQEQLLTSSQRSLIGFLTFLFPQTEDIVSRPKQLESKGQVAVSVGLLH